MPVEMTIKFEWNALARVGLVAPVIENDGDF
jgi:hypothetical protein